MLDRIRVKTDIVGVFVDDTGIEGAHIASIHIGGSLIGNGTDNSGQSRQRQHWAHCYQGRHCWEQRAEFGQHFHDGGGRIASIIIGGSLIGGKAGLSGSIFSDGDIGPVSIRGNVIGGAEVFAGTLTTSARIVSVRIGGSVIGGPVLQTGSIQFRDSGPIHIGGDLVGDGIASGGIEAFTSVASLSIGGSLIGGPNLNSGRIHVGGRIGPVIVHGNIAGGAGEGSAAIIASEITSVKIGGSLIGDGDFSGVVQAGEQLGPVKIAGDIRGGPGEGSGFIDGETRLTKVTIGGSIRSGAGLASGCIGASNGNIGSVAVGGGLFGSALHPVAIFARGQTSPSGPTDVAIGNVTVNGSVEFARILGGFASIDQVLNADAQIGSVKVGGDWVASSISAGIASGNAFFGDGDDELATGASVKDDANVVSKIRQRSPSADKCSVPRPTAAIRSGLSRKASEF